MHRVLGQPDDPRTRLECVEAPRGLGHNSGTNRFRLDLEPVSA
jgi:hypothetical protein